MSKKRGFTLIELSLVLTILALMLVPLLRTLDKAQQRRQAETTATALQNAKEALLAYAVQHRGCLPLAADYEGGLPDTNRDGLAVGNTLDAGRMRAGNMQRAGDLPWSALAMDGRGLTGQQLRLQYFVASDFTGDACAARIRNAIEIWQPNIAYNSGDIVSGISGLYVAASSAAVNVSPPAAPWQLFATGTIKAWRSDASYNPDDYATDGIFTYRALNNNSATPPQTSPAAWRAVGLPGQANLPAWQSGSYKRGEIVSYNQHFYRATAAFTSAAAPNMADWADLSFPDRLLQTRLGPVIDAIPGNTLATAQNIVILIAPSRETNSMLNRSAMRGVNHRDCPANSCNAWTTLNDPNVDTRAFSLTPEAHGNPDLAESILPISLADWQRAMARAGLAMQAVHW